MVGRSKVYELTEVRVVGELPTRVDGTCMFLRGNCMREATGMLSICVFSFVMAYNNKKVGAICEYNITCCFKSQYL